MTKTADPRLPLAHGQKRAAFIVTDWQVGFMHQNDALLLHIPNHGTFAWPHAEAEKMVGEMIKRIKVLRERKKAKAATASTRQ